MIPLAGTREWKPEVVRRRLLFLRQCVAQHRNLSVRLGRLSTAPEERVSFLQDDTTDRRGDGLESQLLLESAEISLVLGDISTGARTLREVVSRLSLVADAQLESQYNGTMQQFVMTFVFGALTQQASVRVTSEGAAVAYSGGVAFLNWNDRAEVQELIRTLPTLLSVVAFSESAEAIVPFLANNEYDRRFALALTAAATQPEFVVLGLLPAIYRNQGVRTRFRQLNRRDGFSALRELELRYSTRIDLLRKDVFHWRTLRPRAELVDWSLLIAHVAHVALIRGGAMRFGMPSKDESLSPTNFSRSLALAFTTLEEQ